MKIAVRYFARVREALGPGEDLSFEPGQPDTPATVGALRQWLAGRSPAHAQALSHERPLRAACDQSMCGEDEPLTDGAEVAFLPPVTGG